MARGKGKGKSGSGADQYIVTQLNLDRKGKTNKKRNRNAEAEKHLTEEGRKIIAAAAAYVKEHPPGSGRRKNKAKAS